ncbi:hypothetical protein FBY34_8867 [Streptomyces sp. SLBN-115]|nr:hypothetical protein FBY34_8867 [Streptomyces sp. SLBN-115]
MDDSRRKFRTWGHFIAAARASHHSQQSPRPMHTAKVWPASPRQARAMSVQEGLLTLPD